MKFVGLAVQRGRAVLYDGQDKDRMRGAGNIGPIQRPTDGRVALCGIYRRYDTALIETAGPDAHGPSQMMV